eukprot:Gregarina_sp_Pseudo_9__587@NODE_1377_length_1650_cov_54_443824_g1285_i0_p1_GENE_NODE_1377_length_1650_cov_54_443824_g1285_i0NODE_1377_length_1650_cov_54_443824_g1285_i0_p1_ORF_typecomplete_len431_score24_57SLC35F/PF06027_12/18SLC35F/PF06027_12/4_5e26Nuc_sug_transp/PF04142_15/88Nuc_sug_transp/PF04142_15/3_4e24CRTlike/PF08627_10/2_2e02CRTlike/PF08627_10/2_1e21UAA/PF08449_11/1e02UAA/PF08449_11/1e13TPT/PF03151_16/3_9e12PUNUT/PF16913_5/1_3e07EamA/PF00892_20/41EamA/PF00892_20/9_7e06EamA/PF00892_20/7_4
MERNNPSVSSQLSSTSLTVEQPAVVVLAEAEGEFKDNDLLELHRFPWWTKWIAAFVCFAGGVFAAYAFKWHNKVTVARCGDVDDPECSPKLFVGAFLQTLLMFLAESICLLIWVVDNHINSPKGRVPWVDFTQTHQSFNKPNGHWWGWVLPACLDNAGTVMSNLAYILTYASTVQMLKNLVVVVCALLQLVVIRRALRIHEWIGTITITGAMVLTAIPAIIDPETSEENDGSKAWLGVLLAILGTSCQGFQIIFEEWLFTKWRYSPIKAVGVEGLAGIVGVVIIMPIAQATGLENVRGSFYQFGHSTKIIVIAVFYIFASIGFNGGGLATTKLGGGLLRAIMAALRAPAVWLLDLMNGWIAFDFYNLGSIFLFLIGFAIHVRCYPPSKLPKFHHILSKPLHFCCTRLELDEDYRELSDDLVSKDLSKASV